MDDNVGQLLYPELECPVCLLVPRSSPIYQCSVGHIVCLECQPKLNACPVCSAKFIKPQVTRNFLAENLLPLVSRRCRYEVFECSFRSQDSVELQEHESACTHKPVIPDPPPRRWSSNFMDILGLVAANFNANNVFLLVCLVIILLPKAANFPGKSHSEKFITISDIANNLKYSYNRVSSILFTLLTDPPFRDFFSELESKLRDLGRLYRYSVTSSETLFKTYILPAVMSLFACPCNCRVDSWIEATFPDYWLPANMEHIVWKPPGARLKLKEYVMDWWPANNSYSDGVEARKSYFDRNWGNSVIRSLSRWKLDLTNTDLTVRSVRLETEGGILVKQWTEDMFEECQEMVVTGILSGKGGFENKKDGGNDVIENVCLKSCPDFKRLRWTVKLKDVERKLKSNEKKEAKDRIFISQAMRRGG